MNTLKAEFGQQVRAIVRQIRDNKSLRGVVLISAKPDNFIAGADINMIARAPALRKRKRSPARGNKLWRRSMG